MPNRPAGRTDAPPAQPGDAVGDQRHPVRHLLGILGPGLVTGAADDDPSGIATYSQTGAQSRGRQNSRGETQKGRIGRGHGPLH